MYCKNCGQKLGEEDRFCKNCGEKIDNESQDSLELSMENEKISKVWLLPLVVFFIVFFTLLGYLGYEIGMDKKVKDMQAEAEQLALEGKTRQAYEIVQKALKNRPNFKALQTDKLLLSNVVEIEDMYKELEEASKKGKYEDALNILSQIEGKVPEENQNLYLKLKELNQKQKTFIAVMNIKNKMKNVDSLQELETLLLQLSPYKGEEAQKVYDEITKNICNVAYKQANDFIKNKKFQEALNIITKGLEYDSSNKQLLSLKETVKSQKENFEAENQKRLEKAILKAQEERDLNYSKAVKVVDISAEVTDMGDFYVYGTIKNIGTRPIYMVEIYYTVYDTYENVLSYNSTYAYPDYLYTGDTASFENIEYGLYDGASVESAGATWYIE